MEAKPTNEELEKEARKALPDPGAVKASVWKVVIRKDKVIVVETGTAPVGQRWLEEDFYILTFEKEMNGIDGFGMWQNTWPFWKLESIKTGA